MKGDCHCWFARFFGEESAEEMVRSAVDGA